MNVSLEIWIGDATRGLAPESVARVRSPLLHLAWSPARLS
jgi:hypothetical protein